MHNKQAEEEMPHFVASQLTPKQKMFILKDFARYLVKRKLLTKQAVFQSMPQYGVYSDDAFYSLDKILEQFNNHSDKVMLSHYKKQVYRN